MAVDRERENRRFKDGRDWRLGSEAEIHWIKGKTEGGVRITSAIPPVFDAYATLELPGTGDHEPTMPLPEERSRHDRAVLAILGGQIAPQPWWLGYLETGSSDIIFADSPKVTLYAGWDYVLVEAGPEQAATWREDDWGEDLPDLMFPADRSWLFSTLWDDDWTCIGGSRALVDALVVSHELQGRVHEVDLSTKDATPPGHVAY